MEYHDAVERLERLQRLRPKLGTETTAAMLASLDDPHRNFDAVQVTGSNGKGSTARLLASILDQAGLTVGLYTSPDLNDIRERITVSGQQIPKSAVTRFVDQVWPDITTMAAEGDGPTFFETLTAMACWHFDRSGVDVAVLEVGIGGRYDATSVVDPVAAAVTNVSLEHTDIIGDTVEEIARDKVQVAPGDRPLVTGATGTALEVLRAETDVVTVGPDPDDGADSASNDTDSPPGDAFDIRVSETPTDRPTLSALTISGPSWSVETRTPLLGTHQAVNAGIAAQLARQVAAVDEADIAAGIRSVHWPGRFEVVQADPLVVLDGAHNPDACAHLDHLLERFDHETLTLVFGAMRDKDVAEMLRQLPDADRIFLAAADVPRAQDVDVLSTLFAPETDATITTSSSVAGAVHDAIRATPDDGCVLVAGSLYVVAEARTRWTVTPRVVRTETEADARSLLHRTDVPASIRRSRAPELVTQTVRLSTSHRTARALVEAMLDLGGTGAVAGLASGSRRVDAVLSGTLGEFRALVRQFRGRGDGERHVARVLTDVLNLDTGSPTGPFPWSDGTAVMGILNVTPDSFHDGGEHDDVQAAVDHATAMVEAGADIVDIGGESTRPGADPVPPSVEQERVVPVVEALADLDAWLSVDTRKPAVADAALAAGADMVNDVTGLADADMRRVVADWDVPAVAMHSLAAPVDPTTSHDYDDVVDTVLAALSERLLLAERDGIDRSKVLLDPGLGFGKAAGESFELLDRLDEFRGLGAPVMVGHSHKSMFADVAQDPDDRFASTIAATALAAERGADVVRVHDVAASVDAVRTADAVTNDE